MVQPDPDYRPNPKRAIFVHGQIDLNLVYNLAPAILRFQHESRDPITVYINSPGGITLYSEQLTQLLNATNQDNAISCRIITVASGMAASAAADLLCAGDYAIAHAETRLLFHGVRRSGEGITVEVASNIADSLRRTNEQYAISLAAKSVRRLGFRYAWMRSEFQEFKSKTANPPTTDTECFIGMISERISQEALQVVKRAVRRNQQYEALVDHVSKSFVRLAKSKKQASKADTEAVVMKSILDFEKKRNSKESSWNFSNGGLSQAVNDFLLVNEYFAMYDAEHLKRLCDNWGMFFLDEAGRQELASMTDTAQYQERLHQLVKPILRPLWLFFIATCYELQNEENVLRAEDAFWLGLIDEVIGASEELFPFRRLMENKPDPTPSNVPE